MLQVGTTGIEEEEEEEDTTIACFRILSNSGISRPTTLGALGTDSVTDFINALPGNSSVNTVQRATIEEAVFSVDPTDAPIDWLDGDHVIYVYCRSMSVPWLYKSDNPFKAVTSYEYSKR
jgi:hypothetical protein